MYQPPVYPGYQPPATFKGTNYFPSITWSRDSIRGLLSANGTLPGFFHPVDTAAEIGVIAAAGLNNIRLFGSFYGWMIDPIDYLNNLQTLCAICNAAGVSITYVFWTTASDVVPLTNQIIATFTPTPIGIANPSLHAAVLNTVATDSRTTRVPPGEPWHMSVLCEPGNELFRLYPTHTLWPNQLGTLAIAYVDQIARFFQRNQAGSLAFASYDVFNEPHIYTNTDPMSPESVATMAFIRACVDRLRIWHPNAPRTVGTGAADTDGSFFGTLVSHQNIAQDYLSFHVYPPESLSFLTTLRAAANTALRVGRQVVCSEFEGVFWNPWRLPQFVAELLTARRQFPGVIGAQVWGFLQSNFVTLDGALVPRRGLEWRSPIDPFVDGVIRPIASGSTPGSGVTSLPFDPNGLAAVQQWTSAP